jgi:hypothetical protein
MISGIFAMVLALLFGLSTQWNFSNHSQTAVVFFSWFYCSVINDMVCSLVSQMVVF